jgi:hypothetical protein
MSTIRLVAPTMTLAHPAPMTAPPAPVTVPTSLLTTAETAECTCPEFCERDHANE